MDRVEMTPTSGSISVGDTLQFVAVTKDASGNELAGRNVTWTSDMPSVAAVSSAGLVTGVASGLASITAASEGKSATAQVTITPAVSSRALTDRPDQLSGPQLHVMYVIPSDAPDRLLDVNGTLARSVASFHTWFSQRSNGLAFRFDTFEGELDVTFHRLARSDGQIAAFSSGALFEIERELREAGRLQANKRYLVYYDGGNPYACGGAAWPPRVPGQIAAMYLRAAPGGVQCGAQAFVTAATEFPRYWEFAMLHDLVHTMGIVAAHAPNHTATAPAHAPEPNDLMFGFAGWVLNATTTIDVGGDDYFGANVPANVPKITDSPFVTTVTGASLQRLEPLNAQAAVNLRNALSKLPVHPPFTIWFEPGR